MLRSKVQLTLIATCKIKNTDLLTRFQILYKLFGRSYPEMRTEVFGHSRQINFDSVAINIFEIVMSCLQVSE